MSDATMLKNKDLKTGVSSNVSSNVLLKYVILKLYCLTLQSLSTPSGVISTCWGSDGVHNDDVTHVSPVGLVFTRGQL